MISSVSSSTDGDGRELDPVRVLEVGDVGQVLLEDQALVVDPPGVSVAPADQRHPEPAAAIPPGDPLDHRRLARSSQRDVAHRDHGDCGPVDRFQPRSKAAFRAATPRP